MLNPVMGGAIFAVLTVPLAAWAQQLHQHPPQDTALHDRFYLTWMKPDNPRQSCCNKHDCYPSEAKQADDGTWLAKRREDGKWLSIPPEKVELHRDSPDGRSHLCAPPPHRETIYKNGVICFIGGTGS